MSGYGLKQAVIADVMKCSIKTLHKYYRTELDEGDGKAQAKIGQSLFNKAMSGDTASLIFLAKTRLGLREVNRLEVDNTSSDGSMSAAASAAAVLSILKAKIEPDDAA